MQRALGACYGPGSTHNGGERAELSEAEGGQTSSPGSEVPTMSTTQTEAARSRVVLALLLQYQWDAKATGPFCLPGLALHGKQIKINTSIYFLLLTRRAGLLQDRD